MYAGRARYALVRSFVEGFGAARDDHVLDGFQQWLSSQRQHRAFRNYAWWSLMLHEVFPERDRVTHRQEQLAGDPGWPVPAPSPVSEDDLAYPDDNAKAIDHMFRRLREYLDSRLAPDDSE
jgi:hypothetical protein